MRILSHPSKRYSPAIFWLSARPRKAEPWIEKIARCTRDVRAIFVDCILLLVIFFAIGLFFQQVFTSATFVEPIDAPNDQNNLAKATQSKIESILYNIENEASLVTPGTIAGNIPSDFDPPDFPIPGTSIPIRTLVKYTKSLLPNRGWTISGHLIKNPDGKFYLRLTMKGNGKIIDRTIDADKMSRDSDDVLQTSLLDIVRTQNPYVYASYIAKVERDKCYTTSMPCDFHAAQRAYKLIIESAKGDPNYKWAILGLSKIEQDLGHPEQAIEYARKVALEYKSGWGYYNWGVSLSDLGCYEASIQPLIKSSNLLPSFEATYNALGRSYLAMAKSLLHMGHGNVRPVLIDQRNTMRDAETDLNKAKYYFKEAIKHKPEYQEAYINLGESLSLLHEPEEARNKYETAIALGDKHAGRAYQKIAEMSANPDDREAQSIKARQVSNQLPECRYSTRKSLRESFGCAEETNGIADDPIQRSDPNQNIAQIPQAAVCKRLALFDDTIS
ncbi:tetratricopeptide repeat protein [Burkholderia ubonensis]|uniref:tetratricopeptide repeat protein n=1 Tax=Burkholderia ubonensis TaxID=101571 RepID=UPI000AAB5EE2|nr:tetratricopeptide repeat protein [Burkholderia ubonensis]